MFSIFFFCLAPGIPPSKMLSEVFSKTISSGLTSPPPWSEHTQKYLKWLCGNAYLDVLQTVENHVHSCTPLTNIRFHLSVLHFIPQASEIRRECWGLWEPLDLEQVWTRRKRTPGRPPTHSYANVDRSPQQPLTSDMQDHVKNWTCRNKCLKWCCAIYEG